MAWLSANWQSVVSIVALLLHLVPGGPIVDLIKKILGIQ